MKCINADDVIAFYPWSMNRMRLNLIDYFRIPHNTLFLQILHKSLFSNDRRYILSSLDHLKTMVGGGENRVYYEVYYEIEK